MTEAEAVGTAAVVAPKKKKKPAAKAKPVKKEEAGQRGRVAAYTGMKIFKLKKTEETGLRESGRVRECWNSIREGMSVDTFRANSDDSGAAQAILRTFVAKGLVKVK